MSRDPRKLIRILVGASLLLHTVVLVDYCWSPSGTPVFWRYSPGRLALMAVYLGFLAGHVLLWIVISHRAAQSHILFGLVFASILYSTAESLIRVHGFGLITPAGRYRAEYWNQNQPNRKWRHIGGRLFTPQLYETEIRNNSAGYHDWEHRCGADPPGIFRILLIGDSFVEAYQVGLAETLQTHLKAHLDRLWGVDTEVIAVGKSGTGLSWQMSMLPDLLECYQPQLVVSDYIPDLFVHRDGPVSRDGPEPAGPPTAVRTSIRWEEALRHNPIAHILIWRNLSNSIGFVLIHLARVLDGFNRGNPMARGPEKSMLFATVDKAAVTYRDLQNELEGLLLVALYPTRQTVSARRAGNSSSPELERRMASKLAAENVPYVSLTHFLAERTDLPTEAFHIEGDGHFTADGHRTGAACIAEFIYETFAAPTVPQGL